MTIKHDVSPVCDSHSELFNVVQFFEDGKHEYVRRFVSAQDAAEAFQHYATSVAAKLGFVNRVIITDGGDCTNAEWIRGKGLVYPPKAG